MQQPIIKAEQLSHRYTAQWAIRDIDFEIPVKGIYGLLGANGSGKSTMMNILCGVLKPTKGDVFINGIDIRKDAITAKSLMGFLPQRPPLHIDLTIEEYLTHCAGLRLIPRKEQARAVNEALDQCGITHFRKRLIRNLSGGYQQRVGIAQAIIHNPRLVVLDEPTNGLDPNQIVEIRNLIKEIARERTVILSTHMLSEVQAACNYILMLAEGRVVFSGSVEEFDRYAAPGTIVLTMLEPRGIEELKRLPNVVGVEPLGTARYRVKVDSVDDMLETIIGQSVQNGWRLREINAEKNSMDTIFAELSKKQVRS
ncbi:ABC transporter ATP-binding protein [Chitinophaga sp. GCM10012297]|uniref:ABC transporter ATP-binding protein n=1 Tax=Chitinophaga chungangae TaxID=2821488 RepID=A0ABS3YFP7_9BACT|nr:ABC transporter ATP-binding protein [Chitinophaga chungangae]MBO9153508.1 ABC transporter ATP-binding protein [Chitinophaga chungangae]